MGRSIVQCSDEYYVTASAPVPSAAAYDGYPQYENGIGMVRHMLEDWVRTKRRLRERPMPIVGRRACHRFRAALAAPLLQPIARELERTRRRRHRCSPQVTKTRLRRTSERRRSALRQGLRRHSSQVSTPTCFILPRPSLDYFGEKFLDSMTVDEVEAALGAPITFATRWSDVVRILAGPAPALRATPPPTAPSGASFRTARLPTPDAAAQHGRTCRHEGSGIPCGRATRTVRLRNRGHRVHALAGPGREVFRLRPHGCEGPPQAALLPPGATVSSEYTVDGSDIVETEPALVRQASSTHSEAAISGYFAQELAQRGWSRTASAAPAKDTIGVLGTNGVHWARGDLRLDSSFAAQIVTPAGGAPLSFTVRITRIRAQ